MLFEFEIVKKGGRQPQLDQQLVTNPLRNLKSVCPNTQLPSLTVHACIKQQLWRFELVKNRTPRMKLKEQGFASVLANRKMLIGVVQTVLFLDRSNLPFRGQR